MRWPHRAFRPGPAPTAPAPQIAARCERLIRLRDGVVVDDIELTEGYPAEDMIRRVGQLG